MMNLLKGQKVDITKGKKLSELDVIISYQSTNNEMEIDAAAFLLEDNGECKNDEQFIFYGNPNSPDGSIKHTSTSSNQNDINILFSSVSQTVQKIAFTLTIHEGEKRGHYFSDIATCQIEGRDKHTGETLFTFSFGENLNKETAIVVGELYRHQGEWKFSSVGSGFFGGLTALCQNFGIDVDETEETPAPPPVKEERVIPLNISLTKKETVSIKKSEKVIATLEWDSKKDLDLYCFYVTKDGKEGKVYYRDKGSSNTAPFITLDGDALIAGKETIIIHDPSKLNYVLFAAYSAVSNGIGSFKSMKARAIVDNQMGQVVTSPLYEKNMFAYWVAIAKIDFTHPSEMNVEHVETYSKSGTERSPLLYSDGTFKMNVGPEEFK
jgi:tellurite resistance protein TerA